MLTKVDRIWVWALLSVVWMAAIYVLSDRPADDYKDASDFLDWLPFADTIAHIGLYFVLSVFVFRMFVSLRRLATGLNVYATLLVALVYGVLDEIHQSNVEGRSSEVGDVVADVFGAVLAVVFWFGLRRLVRMRAEKPDVG